MTRKRVRLSSESRPGKHAMRQYHDDDRISQLSDDILLAILSLLPLNEAARASVLSSRWINLWKQTSCLNLDPKICSQTKMAQSKSWTAKKSEYVKWVNKIMRTHKAAALKELRICYELSPSARKAITRWLKLAFVRRARRLELDFSEDFSGSGLRTKNYAFPDQELLLNQKRRLDFNALKELCLKHVDIRDETIEFLLRNCLSLEKLVVVGTNELLNLEVRGSSLVLKHLEIVECSKLKSVKVYAAPKLTKLVIPRVDELLLVNVPMLVEVFDEYSLPYAFCVDDMLPSFPSFISRLEVLNLKMRSMKSEEIVLSTFPELPKLKTLVVVVNYYVHPNESLMRLIPLIRASPFLERFALTVRRFLDFGLIRADTRSYLSSLRSGGEEVKKNTENFSHQCLKVFEFCSNWGFGDDDGFLGYILKNCIALEKIVFKSPLYATYGRDKRREMKQKLEAQVPHHIETVVCDF